MDLERRKDLKLTAAVAVALALEILWLLHQSRVITLPGFRETSAASGPKIGQVLERTRVLKNRRPRSLTWYPAAAGDAIHLQDTLLTGPASTARIRVEGAGEIFLEPNTLLRFSGEHAGWRSAPLSLELAQGRAVVRSSENEMKVRVRNREFELPKLAEVVLTSEPLAPSSRVEVRSGKLLLPEARPGDGGGDEPAAVPAGEVIEVGEARELSRVVRQLHFEPVAPAVDEVLEVSEPEDVTLRWNGDTDVVLEISSDESFANALKIEPRGNEAIVDLSWGRHYWRARRGDQVGGGIGFEIRPRFRYRLVTPGEGRQFRDLEKLLFRWAAVAGKEPRRYLVQVSRDRAGRDVVTEREVRATELEMETLPPGRYYWRVRAEHPEAGWLPFSSPVSFRVRGPLAPPKPKGVRVLPKRSERKAPWLDRLSWLFATVVPAAHAAEQTLRLEFEWAKVRGAKGYRFEVARDPGFGVKALIARLEVDETKVEVELPIAEAYYWRVTALDDVGELGRPSKPELVRPDVLAAEASPEPPPPAPQPRDVTKETAGGGASGSGPIDEGIDRSPAAVAENVFRPRDLTLRAGVGGAYRTHRFDEAATSFVSTGMPLGRFTGEAELRSGGGIYRAGGWYQSLTLTPSNTELASVQGRISAVTFGARVLRRFERSLLGASWWLGFGGERGVRLVRTSLTTADVRSLWHAALLVGPSFEKRLGRDWHVEGETLFEIAPVGQSRGAGLLAAGRFSHRSVRFGLASAVFVPRVELSASARLSWISPEATRSFDWSFGATLLFTAGLGG